MFWKRRNETVEGIRKHILKNYPSMPEKDRDAIVKLCSPDLDNVVPRLSVKKGLKLHLTRQLVRNKALTVASELIEKSVDEVIEHWQRAPGAEIQSNDI
jgi:hypothetical protein